MEFLAIILCGYGESLYPLTDDAGQCKALLPICNRPMLSYPLNWVEQAGVQQVMVICHQEYQSQIAAFLKSSYGHLKVNVEAPSSVDETAGTADVLRKVMGKITSDFILIGCDFVSTISPKHILQLHRIHEPTLTVLLYESTSDYVKESDRDLIGLSSDRSKLLYIKDMADVEDDELHIRMSMLWKYPSISLFTSMHDGHVYICKRRVLDVLAGKNTSQAASYFKDDILPIFIKGQTSTPVRERYDLQDPSVMAWIAPPEDFAVRTDTLPAYMEANRYFAKIIPTAQRLPPSSTLIKGSLGSTLTHDSLMGANCTVNERTFIKQTTIIGDRVVIGKHVRITSCIIMDDVEICDAAVLENCIISSRARVGERCSLRNCEVAAGIQIARETTAKSEKFVNSALLGDVEEL